MPEGAKIALYSGAVAAVLALAFGLSSACTGGPERGIQGDSPNTTGAVKPLSPDECVRLQQVMTTREATRSSHAALAFALVCASAGLGILLYSAASASTRVTWVTDEQPALGPGTVGLILVVIAALVVLLAPRNAARLLNPPKEPARTEDKTWAERAPPPKDAGADAGTQAP
ncbi:hypothetical protein [Myxococcus sp. RHSTA-1-4]|uniref:hypothetical protein n=1 Tax=Myxococcus sp. RHSTA-1-4 TaxID=2874601 RepID=UPI001CBE6B21|nr:hypothetical protein [Myxococcus sp. RHSTA-1-4]MBZ4420231.1 hypothetical protein [Myxococcus sp. RHSTA-1-4]